MTQSHTSLSNLSQQMSGLSVAAFSCEPPFIYDWGDENILTQSPIKMYLVTGGRRLGLYSGWESCEASVKTNGVAVTGAKWKIVWSWTEAVSHWQAEHRKGNVGAHQCSSGLTMASGRVANTRTSAVPTPAPALSSAPPSPAPSTPTRTRRVTQQSSSSSIPVVVASASSHSTAGSASPAPPSVLTPSASSSSPYRWFVVWSTAEDSPLFFDAISDAQQYMSDLRDEGHRVRMKAGNDLEAIVDSVGPL